jgi:2-(1,2-epoxy-1,2-dihydrophenyl)acetyl-CoA isomerase
VSEEVLCEVSQGVARITLNRPERGNALGESLRDALVPAIDRVVADASVRAILLTAAGKMFCAGGDIAGMADAGAGLDAWMERMVAPLGAAVQKLAAAPVPVVSALNGPVAGGGIGLALCADHVLAAESMKLRGGYSGIAFTADLGTSWFLARRVGPARAKEILFLNRPLGARECLAWGVVDAVHPDDRLGAEADALVRRLADGATLALGRVKRLVDGAGVRTLEEQLALERESMILSARTGDAREGVAAFTAKRAPRFTGR